MPPTPTTPSLRATAWSRGNAEPPAPLPNALLDNLAAGVILTAPEAEAAFTAIIAGDATTPQLTSILNAMLARIATVPELVGAARAMRAAMLPVTLTTPAIDVCGTGGDGQHTLNISTAVALVVAGAGVPVAKHGNRAASSRSGGADVLAALGVRLDPPLARLPAILSEACCVFLFAPRHHAGLRHAAAARAAHGRRTLFNLLGPLANPAGVRRQLTGVFAPEWLHPMAETLASLGTELSWVVHGAGLDELSLAGPNQIVEQRGPGLRAFTLDAAELGLTPAPIAAITGGDAAHNAAALLALLDGQAPAHTAYRDTVLLNAAAALVVAGRAPDLPTGLALARGALVSKAALTVLNRLRAAAEIDG